MKPILHGALVVSFVSMATCTGTRVLENERYACVSRTDCSPGLSCIAGECVRLDGGNPLTDSGVLDGSAAIDSGVPDGGRPVDAGCRADGGCELGAECLADHDCRSGFCTEGVCCDQRCTEGCGTCLGLDAGLCRPKAMSASCGPYLCTGTTLVCPTNCMTSAECAPEAACCRYTACRARGDNLRCVRFPPASSVVDRFDAPSLDAAVWSVVAPEDGTVTVDGGVAQIFAGTKTRASGGRYAALTSRERVSLLNNQASVELVDVSQVRGFADTFVVEFGFFGEPSTDERYMIQVVGDFLESRFGSAPGNLAVRYANYDPTAMRFLRVRHSGNLLFAEFSADGGSYISFRSQPVPDGGRLSDLSLVMGLFLSNPKDAGPSVTIDNINAP